MISNWQAFPDDHPTPSLIIDSAIVDDNLHRMQDYCLQKNLRLRPHTKTHKSIEMARRQIAIGCKGLTVAKAGEASVMANATDDIFVAYPPIGTARLNRLSELAKSMRITVAIDSIVGIEMLQRMALRSGVQIGAIVDVDVGFHRTGAPSLDQVVELCIAASNSSNLEFRGLMCFPGHISPISDDRVWNQYSDTLGDAIQALEKHSIQVETVSGGSTPTALDSHRNPWVNEIRPGTYIYNDANEVALGVASLEQCAARVLATVVSTPGPNKFIVDAGSKTLSSDRNCVDPNAGYGHVVEYPSARITRLSEEHGEIELPADREDPHRPNVGDRVWIIPNHICVCVNLQNEFYLKSPTGELAAMKVDARGMLV